jgi:hypothetical protein
MEHAQMNAQQPEEAAQALVASDLSLQAMDESKRPRKTRPSSTTKPTVSKRKMALFLSEFLKGQGSFLALRRRDDGKQAQSGRE